jgi:hypothetical protein
MIRNFILCPISDRRINERVARTNAAFVLLLLALFWFTGSIVPILVMILDFFLRASEFSKYSPIGASSNTIVNCFELKGKNINAGPKIFAARIGFVFSMLIFTGSLFGLMTLTIVTSGILGLFLLLEAVLGICAACEIYPFLYKFFYKSIYHKH